MARAVAAGGAVGCARINGRSPSLPLVLESAGPLPPPGTTRRVSCLVSERRVTAAGGQLLSVSILWLTPFSCSSSFLAVPS